MRANMPRRVRKGEHALGQVRLAINVLLVGRGAGI